MKPLPVLTILNILLWVAVLFAFVIWPVISADPPPTTGGQDFYALSQKEPIFHAGGIYGWDPDTKHWYFVGPDSTWTPPTVEALSDTFELLRMTGASRDGYTLRTKVLVVLEGGGYYE